MEIESVFGNLKIKKEPKKLELEWLEFQPIENYDKGVILQTLVLLDKKIPDNFSFLAYGDLIVVWRGKLTGEVITVETPVKTVKFFF